jgi:uncharacterized protein with PIN domain
MNSYNDIYDELMRDLEAIEEKTIYNTERLIGKDKRLYKTGNFCPNCNNEMRKAVKKNIITGEIIDSYYCFECNLFFKWVENAE